MPMDGEQKAKVEVEFEERVKSRKSKVESEDFLNFDLRPSTLQLFLSN